MVMMYMYSVGAFVFFADEFHDPEGEEAQYCNSLLQCWVTISHYILIGGVSYIATYCIQLASTVVFIKLHLYTYMLPL